MLESKDPGIKLFGRTIQLSEISEEAALSDTGLSGSFLSVDSSGDDTPMKEQSCSLDPLPDESDLNGDGAHEESKDSLGGSNDGNTEEDGGELEMSKDLTEPNGIFQNSDSATVDDAAATSVAEEEHSDGGDAQEKTLKKPDKILPCPRCNSMDTKFCYYNNYNVNQPRHYCKNCQRYWTAGGSMRNMAIGAGRRKNKNLVSLCRQAQADLPNGIHHPTLKSDCTVNLNFGSDTPLCQSTASELNIADKPVDISTENWFQGPEKLWMSNHYGNIGNVENPVRVVLGSIRDEARNNGPPEELVPNSHSIPPAVACFSGSPWPYPWNFVQWTPPASAVVYPPSGFPMPFYPAPPFWGCALPGVWSVPPCITPPIPGPNSPTLGKHPRDDTTSKLGDSEKEQPPKESNPEKCFWVPKTLRIDDPSEAARSSIWTTLGIKNDRKADSVGKGGGPLNAFESKSQVNNVSTAASVLHANPAALSRAVRFHESS